MVLHGDKDPVVPAENARRWIETMKEMSWSTGTSSLLAAITAR
jgi:hypothetical protein